MTSPDWLAAAAVFEWGFVGGFVPALLPRPPREDWLAQVRWSRWLRYPALIFTVVIGLLASSDLIANAALQVELLYSGWAESAALLGFAVLFAVALRAMQLIATQDGLYFGPYFIPWRDVMEVNFHNDVLWIHLRRRYFWGAKKIVLFAFYEASDSTAERLLSLRNAHVKDQPRQGAV